MGQAQVRRWLDFPRLLHQALICTKPLSGTSGEGLFCVLKPEQIRSKNQYTFCTNLESRYIQNVPTAFSRPSDILIPPSVNPRQKAANASYGLFADERCPPRSFDLRGGLFLFCGHIHTKEANTTPHQFTATGKLHNTTTIKLPTCAEHPVKRRQMASTRHCIPKLPFRRIIEKNYGNLKKSIDSSFRCVTIKSQKAQEHTKR